MFVGGFDLTAASEVAAAGGDDFVERYSVLDQLTLLVDKSLVVAEESRGSTRYRLLETVRQYALEKLNESEEIDGVRARHRTHYATMAAGLNVPASTDYEQRLLQAEAEIDNLRAAFTWSRGNGDIAAALQLASALQPLWSQGRMREGLAWLESILEREGDNHLVPAGVWARALAEKVILKAWPATSPMGAPDIVAQAHHALALARDAGDCAVLARALRRMWLRQWLRHGSRSTLLPPRRSSCARLNDMRSKIPDLQRALEGRFDDHHALMCRLHLAHLDQLDAMIGALDEQIEQLMHPFCARRELIASIPGIGVGASATVISEIGADPAAWFPSAEHLASWVRLCPGNHESAGKRHHGARRTGNQHLQPVLVECAWAAVRTDGYLREYYRRQVRKFGGFRSPAANKKAITTVAHKLIVIIWHVLATGRPHQDLGADYFTTRMDPDKERRRLVAKLEAQGLGVTLEPAA